MPLGYKNCPLVSKPLPCHAVKALLPSVMSPGQPCQNLSKPSTFLAASCAQGRPRHAVVTLHLGTGPHYASTWNTLERREDQGSSTVRQAVFGRHMSAYTRGSTFMFIRVRLHGTAVLVLLMVVLRLVRVLQALKSMQRAGSRCNATTTCAARHCLHRPPCHRAERLMDLVLFMSFLICVSRRSCRALRKNRVLGGCSRFALTSRKISEAPEV